MLLLAALAVYFLIGHDEEVSAVDLLPENVIGYIRQDNLSQIYKKFDSSQLGETVKNIDYAGIIEELGLAEDSQKNFKQIIADVEQTVNDPIVHEVLGEHFVLALLPNTRIDSQVSRIDNLKESILLMARPKRSAKGLSALVQLIPEEKGRGELKYQKKKILYYKLDDQFTLYAAVLGNRILLAFSDTVIKSTIDRYRNKSTGLNANRAFNEARVKHKEALQFAFFQAGPLKETILAYIESYSPEELERITDELGLLDNYSHVFSAIYPAKHGSIKSHTSFVLKPENMEGNMKNLIFVPPEENKMVQMVPNNLLLYYWTNTFKLKDLYEFTLYDKHISDDQVEYMQQEALKITGITLNELFDLFDHRPTFILKNSEVQFFLPVPDFGVYIRVNDKEKFTPVIEKMIKDSNIATYKKKYKEDILTIWGEHSQNSMQLGYTLHGDYLVIASSRSFLENIVNHLDTPVVFSQQNGLQPVTIGFHDESNVLCYVQLRSFFKIMKEVVSWGGTVLAIQDREAAIKSKIVIDKLIHPLLDGLGMYSALGYRVSTKNNTMTVDTVVQIEEEND